MFNNRQLNEISKKTLGSYLEKAAQSYAGYTTRAAAARDAGTTVSRLSHAKDPDTVKKLKDAEDALGKEELRMHGRANKRARGIIRAKDRLTKEEVLGENLPLSVPRSKRGHVKDETYILRQPNYTGGQYEVHDNKPHTNKSARKAINDAHFLIRHKLAVGAKHNGKWYRLSDSGDLPIRVKEEVLDEISNKTLRGYIVKSSGDADRLRDLSSRSEDEHKSFFQKKYQTRKGGVDKAVDKLFKKKHSGVYEQELDEVAPSDKETWVKKNKQRFIDGRRAQAQGRRGHADHRGDTVWRLAATHDEAVAEQLHEDLAVGDRVWWHYRGAIGHGTIKGVAKKGTTSATTEYEVSQHDHHPGEKAVLHHFGSALHKASGTNEEVLDEAVRAHNIPHYLYQLGKDTGKDLGLHKESRMHNPKTGAKDYVFHVDNLTDEHKRRIKKDYPEAQLGLHSSSQYAPERRKPVIVMPGPKPRKIKESEESLDETMAYPFVKGDHVKDAKGKRGTVCSHNRGTFSVKWQNGKKTLHDQTSGKKWAADGLTDEKVTLHEDLPEFLGLDEASLSPEKHRAINRIMQDIDSDPKVASLKKKVQDGGMTTSKYHDDYQNAFQAHPKFKELQKHLGLSEAKKPARGTPDWHEHRIAVDTVKNPAKAFLGGPSAADSKEKLKNKFGYSDDEIKKLSEDELDEATMKEIEAHHAAIKPYHDEFYAALKHNRHTHQVFGTDEPGKKRNYGQPGMYYTDRDGPDAKITSVGHRADAIYPNKHKHTERGTHYIVDHTVRPPNDTTPKPQHMVHITATHGAVGDRVMGIGYGETAADAINSAHSNFQKDHKAHKYHLYKKLMPHLVQPL